MSYFESCRAITVLAGTAITMYKFIAFAADGAVDHVATAQSDVSGIAGETVATAGDALPMIVPDAGVAKVMAGAAVSRGALIGSDNAGRAITWVDAAGNICMGQALEAATAAGDIIAIHFYPKKVGAGS